MAASNPSNLDCDYVVVTTSAGEQQSKVQPTNKSDQMCMGESLSTSLEPLLANNRLVNPAVPPAVTPRIRNGGHGVATTPSPSVGHKSLVAGGGSGGGGGLQPSEVDSPSQPIENFLQQKQWQQYFYGETHQPTDAHTHLVKNRLPTSPSNPFLISELTLPSSSSFVQSSTTTTTAQPSSPRFGTEDQQQLLDQTSNRTKPTLNNQNIVALSAHQQPPKRPARTKPQLTHQQQSLSFDQTNYTNTSSGASSRAGSTEQQPLASSRLATTSSGQKSKSATVSPDPRMVSRIEDFWETRDYDGATTTCSSTATVTTTRVTDRPGGGIDTDDGVSAGSNSVYELCNEILNCNFSNPKICDINVVSEDDNAYTDACEVRVGVVDKSSVCGGKLCKSTTGKTKNPFLSNDVSSNSKRDEFLKATMKICLVVSPPSNRLQLKSRSLTHLDKLEPQIKAQNDISHNNKSKVVDNSTNTTGTTNTSSTNKICCLSSPSSSSIASALATTTAPTTTTATISNTTSISIKKKSSSFLHRDYKKPILARSQISSSEYFSVCFDTENGFKDKDEMFVAATKGITLGDSLRHALTQRSLSLSQISIIDNGLHNQHELGIPQYLGPLDANTDIGSLAGRTLIVTEKDFKKSGHYLLQKAASVGYKHSKSKLFSSVSTEECGESHEAVKLPQNKQTTKQRWSLQFFGVKNPQQTQLCEILNNYMKHGVPKSKSSYCNIDYPEFLEAIDALENLPKSWRDFVNCSGMIETETKIQSAIWELVTTEVDYIHALQTVRDLFLACLEGIQSENILIDVDQNKLFSNIHDICEANLKFWSFYLYPMVKHSILTGHQMCVDYFQQGFVTFATIFAPYTKYCAEQSTCQYYCKELNQNNALFTAYLAWCESQKMCNRLRLADILVRPMQRLTKYSLLLTAIRKHIADENDAEIMDAMIHSVEDFVFSVNSHLTTRQENERLKGIMARIEAYDVVDSNNEHLEKMVKQYSVMFDLCAPMKGCAEAQGRHLFMEGDLKFKDNLGKIDVHCFLLTDILLVCKTIAKKGHGTLKVVRQPFYTDKLTVKLRENVLYCVYFNDLNVVVAAFTLQCSEAKSWHDAITKAKHIYSRLKLGTSWDSYTVKYTNTDTLGVKKSPINSSINSRVSSLNNSHSGSVELNESKAVSVDFEKANSMSSDEGMAFGATLKTKLTPTNSKKLKPSTSNSLTVQPFSTLGQSMPNLNVQNTNNTLLVPGTSKTHSHSHSGQSNLLSPSQRGISYPPPSPTRATLRRGFAFSSSTKNPPLVKTRNIQSQSFNTAAHPQLLGQNVAAGHVSHPTSPQPQQHQLHPTQLPTPDSQSISPAAPNTGTTNHPTT